MLFEVSESEARLLMDALTALRTLYATAAMAGLSTKEEQEWTTEEIDYLYSRVDSHLFSVVAMQSATP